MNKQRFLINSEETGRFIVKSTTTGVAYYVEPIGTPHIKWGDVNPATGKVEGSYGNKYRGSIDKEHSLITKENGFENIETLAEGVSPLDEIYRRDLTYEKHQP